MKSKFIKTLYHRYRLNKKRKRWISKNDELIKKLNPDKITKKEKEEIYNVWGNLGLNKYIYDEFRIYKKICQFDPYYCPMVLYNPVIIRALNHKDYSVVFHNKGLYNKLFTELNRPITYFVNINGIYLSDKNELVDPKQIIHNLKDIEKVLIKPITGSHGGDSVEIIPLEKFKKDFPNIIKKYRHDYVVQEVVKQHDEVSVFNPSSLNTIRITSLNLNGVTSILFSVLKIGKPGKITDNTSSGGIRVKINDDNSLADYGFDRLGVRYKSSLAGIEFSGKVISNFNKLKKLVLDNHQVLYPYCRLVGWDIAINDKQEAVFIEGNTIVPEIMSGQWCCGPLFGNRTEEVINYINNINT